MVGRSTGSTHLNVRHTHRNESHTHWNTSHTHLPIRHTHLNVRHTHQDIRHTNLNIATPSWMSATPTKAKGVGLQASEAQDCIQPWHETFLQTAFLSPETHGTGGGKQTPEGSSAETFSGQRSLALLMSPCDDPSLGHRTRGDCGSQRGRAFRHDLPVPVS